MLPMPDERLQRGFADPSAFTVTREEKLTPMRMARDDISIVIKNSTRLVLARDDHIATSRG